jgi:hypothetical protein
LTRGDPCRQACWGPSQNAHGLKADRMEVDPRRPREIAVGDPHRGPAGTEPAPLGREPVHRPIRHHDPEPGQLAVDVGQHQLVAFDAVPDPALLDRQRSYACPCPDLRAGRTAATTAPSSSSLNCPSPPSRTSPAATAASTYRRAVLRSTRPLTRRAQPLPAQPAAKLPESRSPPPPETPLASSRSLDLTDR